MPVDFSKYSGKSSSVKEQEKEGSSIGLDFSKYSGDVRTGASSVISENNLIPRRTPINGTVEMDDMMGTPSTPKPDVETRARSLPIIGPVLKGLDYIAEKTEPVANVLRSFYVPGAGLGNIAGLTGAAEAGVSKLLPSLGNTAIGRIGQKVASEAAVGLPLGVAQEQVVNPDATTQDYLKGAAFGVGGGAVLGGLGRGASEALRYGKDTLDTYVGNVLRSVNDERSVASPFGNGSIAGNPVARGYTDNVARTFGNAPSRLADDIAPTNVIQPLRSGSATAEPVIQPAPQVLTRSNALNQLKNGEFSDELQGKLRNSDQTYKRQTNVESVEKANEAVKDITVAEAKFNGNKEFSAEHVTTGYRLMQELDTLAKMESNPILKESLYERALNVGNKLAEDLTKAGQTAQAASVLSRLSPEGQLLNLTRTAIRNGKTVTVADSIKFKDLAAKVQERSDAGIRANQFNEILNRLERGENVGVDDLKKLSSFLSGAEKIAKPKVIKVVDDIPAELKEPRKREKVISFFDEAEKAALARIAGRKNNLNSLPVNEWADHAIVVASQIAKGTIKAATHVEDIVKVFGESVRPVATEVFQQAQKLLISSTKEAIAKKTSVAEKVVEKYIKENTKVSEKDISMLRKLADDITKLSGKEKQTADMEMQKILNSYEKSNTWGKLQAIRYIAMLFNSGTQTVNVLSGPAMASTGYVSDIFGTMIDIAMNKTMKTPRTTTLYGSSPLRFIANWFKNAPTGAAAGWHGVNPSGIQGTNEIRGLAFKSMKNPLSAPFSLLERSLGAVAKGADYATYKSVFDAELSKQGYLDAVNKGIKGSQNIKGHIKQFINNPPEEAILQADRIGKNTTFQRSDTAGGKLANYLNAAPKGLEAPIKTIFPFVRTPVNIASTAFTLTPGGIVKGLYQLVSPTSQATQREAIRSLSMGLIGTGIGAIGYYLSSIGVITGANDSGDKDVNAIREQAGQGKYRLNTSGLARYLDALIHGEGADDAEKAAQYQKGDKQIDYNKLQPLAFPAAIGASLEENKGKDALSKAAKTSEESAASLLGMSSLKGLQDTFQPQYGGTQGEKTTGIIARLVESYFKSFSPSALAQEARRQDPIQRKVSYNNGIVQDVKEYFQSRTPGLSQSLPPNKTTLGQNKLNADGVLGQYANPYKSDVAPYTDAAKIISDLIDRTGDFSLAPSVPEKTVRGKDRKGVSVSKAIPPERYAQLQEEVGNEIIKRVSQISPSMPDDKKADKLKEIYSAAKEKARDKVKRELGLQ